MLRGSSTAQFAPDRRLWRVVDPSRRWESTMPQSVEEERELALMVLRMGTFELGCSLTPFGSRRCASIRRAWLESGWIAEDGSVTASGRQGLRKLARPGH
jgi:hypothetical protein